MSRSPGDSVLIQEIWHGHVWSARPMTVVRDEDDFVALWFPVGTRFKRPIPPPGAPTYSTRGKRLAECLRREEWAYEDAEWNVSTLVLMRPGDWHAIWCSWRDGTHLPWYVNLQEPFTRTTCGFETMDLALDLVVFPDGRWYWKDEDELATFVEAGVLDGDLAARLRNEGLTVLGRAERNESPFDEPWPDWRPNPEWRRPERPNGWGKPCR